MTITTWIQKAQNFEIQTYKKSPGIKALKSENIPFSGSPFKHPYDTGKVVLIADPYSTSTFYYEFKTEDITFVEELPTIVNMVGENVPMARVWVKKKRVGLRCTPFVVENLNVSPSEK
jgi:inorganic pyrophosphatase